VSQAAALDEGTAGSVITDDVTAEFHSLGPAGCIDKLTAAPLHRRVRTSHVID
jgi:hypothetical protein